MHVLIVEDEYPTALDLQQLVKKILKGYSPIVHIETSFEDALLYIKSNPIDVLLLDLNLNSKDGYQILQQSISSSFHTIIISANIHRAIEAFQYQALDFIPKPYAIEQLKAAFDKLFSIQTIKQKPLQSLPIKRGAELKIIPINQILYFKADNIYVRVFLENGMQELYDKPMKKLEVILPPLYVRIHKSYIVNIEKIEKIISSKGGKYTLVLKNGSHLPLSRKAHRYLSEQLRYSTEKH